MRFEALMTDAYFTIESHLRLGKTSATDQVDSVAYFSLTQPVVYARLIKTLTAAEPSSVGYQKLKLGLRSVLDALSLEERQAVLSDSPASSQETSGQIETIAINLERWRLEKQAFGDRYVFINIPAFMLYVVESDSVVFESRVIVGKPDKQTPLLSSTIECFITYPYWHVPRKIAVEEFLPLIRSDTSFLVRNNFDVLDRKGKVLNPDSVNWKKFNKNNFPVLLRQREGQENSLGIIKFSFDNPYAVFLHDTNAKRLFTSEIRAFSHGCIRMEKAVALAHYLVMGDLEKTSKYVERFLKEKSRHTVELARPIPIHVRYFTCSFENGIMNYYYDVYGKDPLIAEKLRSVTDVVTP
jgi:murein L,D-transpeptidase YcbB/YkuD